MKNYASVLEKNLNRKIAHVEGSGAAGGLGVAGLAYLNARIEGGIHTVMKILNF